ncbi:MAG: serine--tRNA ligase [Patescibacteria group bacterium]|nr:serine--tRNA ligase [Patescibacteria group bacterium]
MIDLKDLFRNPEKYRQNLIWRNRLELLPVVDELINLKREMNSLIKKKDEIRYSINKFSEHKPDEQKIKELRNNKKVLRDIEENIRKLQQSIEEKIDLLPNLISEEVPRGKSEEENVVIREIGERPFFNFRPKDHVELGQIYDLIDIERAAKVSGSRFYYLKNEAVLLELALVRFVFDILLKEKFVPVLPPVFIKERYYRGMGRLSLSDREERYFLEKDNLYLVGSAEHTLGPYFADEILKETNLPIRFLGFSTCFRREAGSYGKDVRGILRVHQFDKVEMFSFVLPENSEAEHQFLLSLEERIVQALDLPYRVVFVCSGDIGFTDYKQYDIEVWLPGQERYRETHSCSNTTDFQARGINLRIRRKNGKIEYPHLLNATALAIGRILIAILENYQRENYIEIPPVLKAYLPFDKILPK